jgi:hypothetical protein
MDKTRGQRENRHRDTLRSSEITNITWLRLMPRPRKQFTESSIIGDWGTRAQVREAAPPLALESFEREGLFYDRSLSLSLSLSLLRGLTM